VVEQPGQPPLHLQVNDQTTVRLDGKNARPEEVRKGAEVRVYYRQQGNQRVANRIDGRTTM
jgi:hypothetical protein